VEVVVRERGTRRLTVTILAATNPDRQPFTIVLSARSAAGAEAPLGAITTLREPPTRSTVALSPELRSELAQSGMLALRLTLRPIANEQVLHDPLVVTLEVAARTDPP
jgi:hypothetical protein